MLIKINDRSTLLDIQELFNDFLPYLKVEFYQPGTDSYNVVPDLQPLDRNFCIGDLHPKIIITELEVLPGYRAADLLKEMQVKLGLAVQLFRREKSNWEPTTGMEDFTLAELNQFGKDSSGESIPTHYSEDLVYPEQKAGELL